ncbi:MAG: GNAT family N-acetyltransferase, partial [Steroidobacteraceae bacterium]
MSSDVTFGRESLAQVRSADLDALLMRHYLEIAHFKDIPLEVDWDRYAIAEEQGRLRAFTARAGTQLIGYAGFLVGSNLHFKTSLQAVQDVLFLVPEYRNRHIGLQFLRYCDEELRSEGVQAVYLH